MHSLTKAIAILFCIYTAFIQEIHGATVRAYCFEPGTGYSATFRLRKDGVEDNHIDGLQAYDASKNPLAGLDETSAATDAMCMTTSTIRGYNNIYSVSFEFSTATSTCGSFGSKVQVRATGTSRFWEFDCADGNSIPHKITAGSVEVTGGEAYHHHLPNPWDVRFQAFEASGSNTPARSVHYGQDIKLRLIYCEEFENGLDNWGYLFHTGFIPHDTASDLILQIVTPGLGTNVHIQGTLEGHVIDVWVKVKRDHAAELRIPIEYMETDATELDWTIQSRGIRIQSRDDRIGLRAISNDGSGSSFIVLPDDILGTVYNGITLKGPEDEDGEVLVVAAQDNTSVSVVYNSYGSRSDLDVDGVDADTGASTDNIIMDEFDVLHVRCNDECYQLKIVSDKPIAVIFGADNKGHHEDIYYYYNYYTWQGELRGTPHPGHVSTQLIPVQNYHDHFVLVPISSSSDLYIAQNEDPNYVGSVYYEDWAGGGQTLSNFPYLRSYNGEHVVESFPVGYYVHAKAGGDEYDPYLYPYPSVDQWGAYNYFYAKEGVTYSLIIVGRIGEVANIAFKTGSVSTNLVGSTLGDQLGFATSSLRELSDDPKQYERYDIDITVTDTRGGYVEQGLIELKGGKPWNTFQIIIQEEQGSYRNAYLPWGVRYDPSNPCVTSTFVRPGDLRNNDCDREIDEEILNGIDDDKDGLVDEDVALGLAHSVTGIYVKDLYLCSDAECEPSKRVHIHTAGCYNTSSFGDYNDLKIEPFVHNTHLADEFDNYFVIDTPFWHAFRDDFVNDMLHFKVVYGLCFGDLSRCEQSCPNSDMKRSVEGEENGVFLTIPVIKTGTRTVQQGTSPGHPYGQAKSHPCSNNPVFWVPVLLLLAIILVAVVGTVFFTYKWYQFRQLVVTLKDRRLAKHRKNIHAKFMCNYHTSRI